MKNAPNANAPTSRKQPLNIAVMGAGAVGCYYGGMLARAGHAVTLVGRSALVQAVQAQGLRIQGQQFDETVQLQASTDPAAVAQAELLLFCVKSGATEATARLMAPHVRAETLVLSLQNGVDNADRLQALLPGRTVAAAVVYVAVDMAGPGHVLHKGRGELVLSLAAGAGLDSHGAAAVLSAAGIPAEVSGEVRAALWTKLVINCAHNAISAISQQPYGQMIQAPGVKELMQDVVSECLAVAAADGVTLGDAVHTAVAQIAQTMPRQLSSTAQDLARGKPTEIDHLNGYVLRRGQALSVSTPVNRSLWSLVKLLESRGA